MEIIYKFDFKEGSDDLLNEEILHQATDMLVCIGEIKDQVRSWNKYDERSAIPTEEILDKINDIICEHVRLDKMGY